jgi:hypothetical protein
MTEQEKLKKENNKQQLWQIYKNNVINDCLIAQNLTLWPKQDEIIRSNARIKIIRAARNTAKSWNGAFLAYALMYFGGLFNFPMHIAFAGPTASDTQNLWEHYLSFLKECPIHHPDLFPWMEPKIQTHEAQHRTTLTTKNNSWIHTASLQDRQASDLRGPWFDLVIYDEFGGCQYPMEAFGAGMHALNRPASRALNQAYICGTPARGASKFFDFMFEKAKEKKKEEMQSWHLIGSDNEYRDQASVDLTKSLDLEILFRTEELGESVPPTGFLFPEFNTPTAVRKTAYNPAYDLLIGTDFGRLKPAVIFAQYINNTVYVLHELSLKNVLVKDLANEITLTLSIHFDNATPTIVGCDKSSNNRNSLTSLTEFQIFKQLLPQATFQTHTSLISKGNQVNTFRTLMQLNQLIIDPSCRELILAITSARPDTTRQTDALKTSGWKKIKGHDDPLDALAYALINFGPTSLLFLPKETKNRQLTDEEEREILAQLA